MSASSHLLSKSPEIRVVCLVAVLTWTVFTGTSSGCTWSTEAEPRWRELDGVRSWPQAPRQLYEPLLVTGASPAHKPPRHDPPPRIMRTLLGDDNFSTRYP
jgi:hypothetical protein